MIAKEMVAILGLVAAVVVIGSAFNYTLFQFTLQTQKNDELEKENESLAKENKDLQAKVEKLEKEISEAKASLSRLAEKQVTPERGSGEKQESGKPTSNAVTIASGLFSHILKEKNVIIKNNDELLTLWEEMVIPEAMPSIDFRNSIVIGTFYGEKPNMCYRITIDSVQQFTTGTGSFAVALISKTVPSDDSQCIQRAVQPYHLVIVPFVPEVYFNVKEVMLE